MAEDYASAVRVGAMEANRLHRRLETRTIIQSKGGCIDVFGIIYSLQLPLLLRPLKGLLGAYMNNPIPGILVTTERPLSIQRFTAAHELGHFAMNHEPSLDDENILRRLPNSPEPGGKFEETEADAFAVAFMIPKWLILDHCIRQSWNTLQLEKPHVVYQLSLRIGASYEATCRSLFRYELISFATMKSLTGVRPKEMKRGLLADHQPESYHGDVWLLTEADIGTRIEGSQHDLFVIRLKEHSGSGFLWNRDQLQASGFSIIDDFAEPLAIDDSIGDHALLRIIATAKSRLCGQLNFEESRPWMSQAPLHKFQLDFDMTGPEPEGLSRAERRHILEAA